MSRSASVVGAFGIFAGVVCGMPAGAVAQRAMPPGSEVAQAKPSDIPPRVMNAVAAKLKLASAKVTAASDFRRDLKADNLDMVEIMLALEAEFGIVIPDKDADTVKTVADAIALVTKIVAAKK
jgi:acyl carrier protein